MADLFRFVSVLLFIVLLVFLEGTRFLSVGGITPNLALVFFLGLIFIPVFRGRIRPDYFSVLLIFFFLAGAFLFEFWIAEWTLIAGIIVLVRLLNGFLTGHPFPDFLISIVFGTILFFVLVELFIGGTFAWGSMLEEILYNLILGTIFWLSTAKMALVFREN